MIDPKALVRHLKASKTDRLQGKELVIILREKGVLTQADVNRIKAVG